VYGTHIFHQEVGAGRPLVLLHGIGDSHRTWRKIVQELAPNRRLYMPDLPGCGLSGRPDASYSLDWQARVMDAWMATVGLDDVDVVGHSYGGGVALYMLLLQQKRIRRLALIAAGGCGREVSPELRLASLPWIVEHFGQPFMGPVSARALRALGGVLNPADEAWLREVNGRPGTARALARTIRDVIDWRGQTRHFGHRATEVAQFPPTAILWGTRDRVIPHAHALATKQLLQGAEFTTFSGCGHFPHLERPGEVAKVLTSFFDAATVSPVRFAVPPPVRRRLPVRVVSACWPRQVTARFQSAYPALPSR
jgi:pimeloyl-ACP methyl ester carboxylesterase